MRAIFGVLLELLAFKSSLKPNEATEPGPQRSNPPHKMVRVSVLNDALKTMYNAEKRGKRQVMIRPSSKVIIKFLIVMQKHGYIGEFEFVDDHRSGKIVVELNGRLNKCGVISPRFDVGVKEIESWTARLLPSRQFGYIVLTTSAGIMDHEEARRKNVGGKVLEVN
uniref:Small ribosomal subunit protein uS8c n=1 Tax=Oryza meridionalis TaxID=40149 RepID=A0A0E0CKH1_9ORYZ